MTIKHIALLSLVLLALPGVMAAADFRTKIEITLPADSTVADALCSTHNGHQGFNMPLAPQLTDRKFWQAVPAGMSEYPALYKTDATTLTTASMIRFIKQSPTLFTDKAEQANYKKAVQTCISAHKKWYTAPYPENLTTLHQAEHAVFELLKTLNLSDGKTRQQLEKILSTPLYAQELEAVGVVKKLLNWAQTTPKLTFESYGKIIDSMRPPLHPIKSFKQIFSKATLPWRSRVISKANTEMVVQTSSALEVTLKNIPTGVIVSSIPIVVSTLLVAAYKYYFNIKNIRSELPWTALVFLQPCHDTALTKHFGSELEIICGAVAMFWILKGLHGWFTDFKLTPEPEGGIKVIIQMSAPVQTTKPGN